MSSLDTSKDFLKHVFNMNEESKKEMMNIIQYAVMSLVPLVVLNKTMSKYVPEAEDKKGSVEICAEILLQIIVMFIGLLFIHRINTFIPTFSGEKYPDMSIINIILSVLIITLSLQTKLGEKVSIISERVIQMWEGKEGLSGQEEKQNSKIKVSQPLSNPQMTQMPQVHVCADKMAMNTNSTPISQLPMSVPPTTQTSTIANNMMNNNNVNYNNTNHMMISEPNEPMAANDGGGMFSSW